MFRFVYRAHLPTLRKIPSHSLPPYCALMDVRRVSGAGGDAGAGARVSAPQRRLNRLLEHVAGSVDPGVRGDGVAPSTTASGTPPETLVPQLPLHSLEVTLARIVEDAVPLLRGGRRGSEAQELDLAAKEFLASPDAPRLQEVRPHTVGLLGAVVTISWFASRAQHVASIAEKHPLGNFMLEYWNKAYLSGRYPVSINVNPFLAFGDHACLPTQVGMAAGLAHHTAKLIYVRTRPEARCLHLLTGLVLAWWWSGGGLVVTDPPDGHAPSRL